VGITMKIVNKDWSAWAKDMDEYNFDMTWIAWGSGLFKDPEQLWSSREGARKGSSNLTGFSNPEVDALIEKQKTIFNVAERNAILRQIDAILCREVPYILLWNINYARILYWNKFGTPPAVMSKYGQDSALSLWWNDPDRADELREAMKSGTPLPPEPARVQWED
jgi:microcin C transport system substrate-binding protein